MGRIGFGEILLIALVVILIFGANKLPEIGNALGKAIREFKKGAKEAEDEVKKAINDGDAPKAK